METMTHHNYFMGHENTWETIYNHHERISGGINGKELFQALQYDLDTFPEHFNITPEINQWITNEIILGGDFREAIFTALLTPYQLHYLLITYLNMNITEYQGLIIWHYLHMEE
jgi:hypothetical protein